MPCALSLSQIVPPAGCGIASALATSVAIEVLRRAGLEVHAVRVGLRRRRREPPIAQRERVRAATSRTAGRSRPSSAWRWCCRRARNPSMRPLSICRCVAVHDWETPRPLWHGRARGTRGTSLPAGSGLLFSGTPRCTRVAVAARVHAEVRVVGVVLLHVDDDVLDLREQVDALGPARVGPVPGLADVVRKRAGQVPASGEQHARTGESVQEATAGDLVHGRRR